MAEGRSKALWNHTSSIWALFSDIYREPGTNAKFKLADFNPHLRKTEKAKPVQTIEMTDLKQIMVASGLPQRTMRAPRVG